MRPLPRHCFCDRSHQNDAKPRRLTGFVYAGTFRTTPTDGLGFAAPLCGADEIYFATLASVSNDSYQLGVSKVTVADQVSAERVRGLADISDEPQFQNHSSRRHW